MLISACASDEPGQIPESEQTPQPEKAIQAREWYPTPRIHEGPYYGFDTRQGQMMQQMPAGGAAPQYGQGYSSGGQSWQSGSYSGQPGASQYPATGGWNGYAGGGQQVAPPQQQGYYPTQPAMPQPSAPPATPAPQYQPYYTPQPQYPAAQRPWGTPGNLQGGTAGGRQGIETWQVPGQYPGWTPPAQGGAAGQYGSPSYPGPPVYYW
jgi:hypothetical protein